MLSYEAILLCMLYGLGDFVGSKAISLYPKPISPLLAL